MIDFVERQMKLYFEDIDAYQKARLESYRSKLEGLVEETVGNQQEKEKKLFVISNGLEGVAAAIEDLRKS